MRGLEVNRETLAVDLIKRVGIGGNYLAEEHTVRHLREVTWFPRLTSREKWDPWMAAGGLDMRQRAAARAREILASHRPQHLEPKLAAELWKMARARQQEEIEGVRSGRVVY